MKAVANTFRVAILGPITTSALQEFLPDLSDDDVLRAPGMGGHGLMPLVLGRVARGLPTDVITLDPSLIGGPLKWESHHLRLSILSRRAKGLHRDFFREERRSIAEAIRASRADVIHANWTYEYALAALESADRRRVVVTVRDHAMDILRYSGVKYLPDFLGTLRVYRHGSHFTAVSPYVQKFAQRISRSPVSLIPNAVLPEIFRLTPQVRSTEPSLIVSATQWAHHKNPMCALQAFGVVRQASPDAELHITGSGTEREGPAHSWARMHGLDAGVVFHGQVPHDRLLALIRSATIYLHTSRTEACNMAVAEATALGVPVVAGRASGGVPWQLDFGKAGALVDTSDPSDVARALTRLMHNHAEREALALNGAVYARRLYDIDRVLDSYEEVYERALACS